jgi:hypothetical protein
MNYATISHTSGARHSGLLFPLSTPKLARPLAFLLFLGLGCGTASAQICGGSGNATETVYYHGYGDNEADGPGNGASTVEISTYTETYRCGDGGPSRITITTYNYVDGPGGSDYDAHDYVTCEVTGDYFNCDDY